MDYLNLKLKGERFPSPTQIFIRKSEHTKTDENIFKILGWDNYEVVDNHDANYLDTFGDHFCITECDNWIHLLDSFFYTLWAKIEDNPNGINLFEGLGIFDEIFGFHYHHEMEDEYYFFISKVVN